MRSILFFVLFLVTTAAYPQIRPFSHELLDQVLQAHVDSAGMVDYPALKASRTALDAYVDSLGETSPRSHPGRFPTRQHELAYWINAYNAFVLRGVVDAYPVASVKGIMALSGFFTRKKFATGGQELTLNDLENEIVRPLYQDPRIHFAINCGAFSCPPLQQRAFAGEDLDTRLQQALERFARNPKYVRLDYQGRQLHLSKILDWYGQDFIKWFPQERKAAIANPTIVDYLFPYLPEEMASYLRQYPDLQVTYDDYDWALNAQTPSR
jgi:hypothetical protein